MEEELKNDEEPLGFPLQFLDVVPDWIRDDTSIFLKYSEVLSFQEYFDKWQAERRSLDDLKAYWSHNKMIRLHDSFFKMRHDILLGEYLRKIIQPYQVEVKNEAEVPYWMAQKGIQTTQTPDAVLYHRQQFNYVIFEFGATISPTAREQRIIEKTNRYRDITNDLNREGRKSRRWQSAELRVEVIDLSDYEDKTTFQGYTYLDKEESEAWTQLTIRFLSCINMMGYKSDEGIMEIMIETEAPADPWANTYFKNNQAQFEEPVNHHDLMVDQIWERLKESDQPFRLTNETDPLEGLIAAKKKMLIERTWDGTPKYTEATSRKISNFSFCLDHHDKAYENMVDIKPETQKAMWQCSKLLKSNSKIAHDLALMISETYGLPNTSETDGTTLLEELLVMSASGKRNHKKTFNETHKTYFPIDFVTQPDKIHLLESTMTRASLLNREIDNEYLGKLPDIPYTSEYNKICYMHSEKVNRQIRNTVAYSYLKYISSVAKKYFYSIKRREKMVSRPVRRPERTTITKEDQKFLNLTGKNTEKNAEARQAEEKKTELVPKTELSPYRVQAYNAGFLNHGFIMLPAVEGQKGSSYPMVNYTICQPEDFIPLNDQIYSIKLDDKTTLYIDEPCRFTKAQMMLLRKVVFKYLVAMAVMSTSYQPGSKETISSPLMALQLVDTRISLSQIAEIAKYCVQMSQSFLANFALFWENETAMAFKSLLHVEILLRMKSMTEVLMRQRGTIPWKIEATPKGDEMVYESNQIIVENPFIVGSTVDLDALLNIIHVLLQTRSKNMHPRLPGKPRIIEDLSKLALDAGKYGDTEIKNLTTDSKFTYNENFISSMKYFVQTRKIYKDLNGKEIDKRCWKYGTFSNTVTLGSARGSRQIQKDYDIQGFSKGFYLRPSTSVQESLIHKGSIMDQANIEARRSENMVVAYAQKNQVGKDRGIAITQFPTRCLLKVVEDIYRAQNQDLDNEAISTPGEEKPIQMQNKVSMIMNSFVQQRQSSDEPERIRIICLSADNQKHSEHWNTEIFNITDKLNKNLSPEQRSACLKMTERNNNRELYRDPDEHEHVEKVRVATPGAYPFTQELFKGESHAIIKDGWPQGFFNHRSTHHHTEAQIYAMEIVKAVNKKIFSQTDMDDLEEEPNEKDRRTRGYEQDAHIEWYGGVHSDDSFLILLFKVAKGMTYEEHGQILIRSYYWCMQAAGMRLSTRKTHASAELIEFLSRCNLGSNQLIPWSKEVIGAVSGVPYTGLKDDMMSGMSKVMSALKQGMPPALTHFMWKVIMDMVDESYSTHEGGMNDLMDIFKVRSRSEIPIPLGGYPIIDPQVS
jgi:hypothetical protein